MTTPPKAPKCETCNDHGEIGCLRPDGYDGERCPDCNPAEVKRYHVTEAGLVEGSALGRLNVVLASDYDAAVAHIHKLELLADQEMKSTELATNAGLRVCLERDALQLRLNNSEQWNDELLGLLRKAAEFEVGENDSEDWQHLLSQISLQLTPIEALKPADGDGKPCACPGCDSARRANSPFCGAHRSAKSRTRGQNPLTAEGLEWFMQNDGLQQ